MDHSTHKVIKVLVIEDENLIRKSLKRSLSKRNYLVETAENGLEGLNILENFEPDVVLLDWIMPKMNGKAVCESDIVKRLGPKIIVMSAYQNEKDKLQWEDYPIHSFIQKPFHDFEKVIVLIEEALNGRCE